MIEFLKKITFSEQINLNMEDYNEKLLSDQFSLACMHLLLDKNLFPDYNDK